MDKAVIIKATEIKATYMQANGYHADEVVGASDVDMRAELIEAGYAVEEIPASAPRPAPAPATAEETETFARFFA